MVVVMGYFDAEIGNDNTGMNKLTGLVEQEQEDVY